MIAAKAKENLSIAGASYSPKEGSQNSAKVTKPIDTRDELALQLEEMISAKGKEQQGLRTDICQKSDKSFIPIDTRAELALQLEEMIRCKAKERQKEHGNTAPGRSLLQNSAEVNTPINAQRELALQLEEMIRCNAKERQGTRTDILQNSVKCYEPVNAQRELAQIAGVSHDTIHKVKAIEANAPERIKQQVRSESCG